MIHFSSLRFRLLVLVFFAILPTIALTISGSVAQRRMAAASAQDSALILVNLAANNHEALFEGGRQLLIVLAHLPAVFNAEPDQCNALMTELVDLYPPFINLGVIALDGTVVCSGLPTNGVVNLADRLYFRDALESKALAVGNYQIGRVTGKPSINMGYPILDHSGMARGVVYVAIGLEWLDGLFNRADLPPNSVLTVVDSDGIVLARHPISDQYLGRAFVDVPVIQTTLARKEGTTESVGVDGVPRLYAFSRLGDSSSEIFITIGIPSSVAFAHANSIATRNIILVTIVILLAMLLAWAGSFILVLRPVNRLVKTVQRLTAGDLSVRAEAQNNVGELEKLAQAFNHMAVVLEQRERERDFAADELRRSEQNIRQAAARTEALLEAAARLNDQLELSTVLNTVCQVTAQAMGVSAVTISLYDQQTDRFVHRADLGLPPEYRRRVQPVPRHAIEEMVKETATARRIPGDTQLLIRPDIQQSLNVPNAQVMNEFDIRTVVSAGLTRGEQPIGRLTLVVQHEPREFSDTELALLTGLANQAVQAVANARLFNQAQRRLRRMQALYAIDQIIIASRNLSDTLQQVSEQIVALLDVDAVAVLLLNPQSNVLEYAGGKGFRTDVIQATSLPLGEGYAGRSAQSRESIHIVDISQADNFFRSTLRDDEGFCSYWCAPLIARGEIKGVLELFHRVQLEPNNEWDAFLESVAVQTAIAIDSVQLYVETRHLLEEAQEQARFLQQIMDTIGEGMLLLDAENRVLLANPAAQSYLPLLTNVTPDGILHSLNGKTLGSYLQTSPSGVWHEVDIPHHHRHFQLAAHALDRGPQSGGWVLAVRDVTEERKQQAYVHTQERLATVGQMAAGIAHDFNNIMGAIVLYTQLLRSNAQLTVRDDKYLVTINEQAKHASNLIHQILDFSRQSVIQRDSMDLGPFVKELVKLFERTLPESIQLHLDMQDEVFLVSADPTRLQQALMNLAINASHAMPTGGTLRFTLSRLTLRAREKPPLPDMHPGEWISIAVADTGSGIPVELHPRLFEPFFTTKSPDKGTGLGLPQVHGIVQQHDGRITFESEVGQGTTFVIYLPALVDVPAQPFLAVSLESGIGGGETILLVEDNGAVREATYSILSLLGYQMLCAEDGQAALELCQTLTSPVDLVLSDLVMPRMGGIALCQALQRQFGGVKIVIMSGYPLEDEGRNLLEQGIVDWIQKPFDQNQIAYKLRAVLDA